MRYVIGTAAAMAWLATGALSAADAQTATDPQTTAAEELLQLSGAEKSLEQVSKQMKQMFATQFAAMNVPPERRAITEKYFGQLADLVAKEMSWQSVRGEFISLYTSIYMEEEIRELIKFYKSPIGQRFVEKMPLLTERTMQISQTHMKNLIPEIQRLSQQLAEEIKASN